MVDAQGKLVIPGLINAHDHSHATLCRSLTYDAIVGSRKRALPFMTDAHRKVWAADISMNRFIGRTHR